MNETRLFPAKSLVSSGIYTILLLPGSFLSGTEEPETESWFSLEPVLRAIVMSKWVTALQNQEFL